MLVTTLSYKTDLKSGLVMQPLNNAFMTDDDDAHRFEVRCFYGNEPVDLIGAGITGYFVRQADGATLPIAGNVEDNAAVVVLPAACYAIPGRFSLVIKVTSLTVIQSVLWVEGTMSRSHTDSVVDPGTSVPSLDELLAKIDAIERVTTRAERVANMTAKAQTLPAGYDASAHYDKETGVLTIGVPLSKFEGGGGGSLPEGGEPYKQLVTDGKGNTVWADRLAYAETLKAEVLPETELIWVEDAGAFGLADQPTTMPAVGINHKVTYNGTTYECVGMPYDDGSMQGVFLGNEGIFSDNIDPTGPLFALIILSEEAAAEQGMWGILFALDGASSATVSVEIDGENVKQIDRKFVPDSRFLVSVTGEDGIPSSYKADCTYEQLLDAYNAGQPLVCRFCNTVLSETFWNYYTHDSGPEGTAGGYIRFVRSVTSTHIEWIDIRVDLDGNTVATHSYNGYSLPIAYKDVLGAVRVGDGLKIDEKTGVLSVDKDVVRTPVKGEDYYTPADQEAIVQQVIASLGTPVFGTIDENNHITLSGHLVDGTYTLTFEDTDGFVSDVCTIDKGATYTNVLPLAIASDGTPFNGGQGWKDGYRLNSSATESQDAAADVTGFIPARWGDTLYLSGVSMLTSGNSLGKTYIYAYSSTFENLGAYFRGDSSMASAISKGGITTGADGKVSTIKLDATTFDSAPNNAQNMRYVRFSCEQITDESIVTVNEPIE